jgi:hypothetical protein
MCKKPLLLARVCSLAILAVGMLPICAENASVFTGDWAWTVASQKDTSSRTNTLVLKVDGDKLSGNLSTRLNNEPVEIPILDGKITGDQVVFCVAREIQGSKVVFTYTGKLAGDIIKGKTEWERNGAKSREWEAKRKPSDKKAN